jgi:hypothetical protein
VHRLSKIHNDFDVLTSCLAAADVATVLIGVGEKRDSKQLRKTSSDSVSVLTVPYSR